MIQPKIDPLDEAPRNVAVVIFDKDDAIFDAGFAREFVNLLDKRLAAFIARMRLTGEDKLHWPRRVVEQFLQPLFVAKQERAAFVSGETSRKANGQDFRVENTIDVANRFRRVADPFAPRAHAFAHKFDQTQLKLLVGLP